jgi:hypothetical protein
MAVNTAAAVAVIGVFYLVYSSSFTTHIGL